MPSFSNYGKYLGMNGHTLGEVRKDQGKDILEWTWDGDPSQQIAYQFDMYHDPDPYALDDVKPTKNMIPLDIKFIRHQSQTLAKDQVSFHLQLKPSQKCNVDYYYKYEDMYGSAWPLGEYILIKDTNGKYNRWLVVAEADINDIQFPTWEILRCDHCVQYIMDGKRQEVACVLQSQNSYNSGIWTDYKLTTVQDQQKFVVPLNRDTEKIYYNLRIIVDAPVLTEPRTWKVSKVNRIQNRGLAMITMAQDQFNSDTDLIETDEEGNVVGMWADYWASGVEPEDKPDDEPMGVYSKITYTGKEQVIKINGSFKKFEVQFFDDIGPIPFKHGIWKYYVEGEEVGRFIKTDESNLNENQIRIKFIGPDDYIGKDLVVSYRSDVGVESSIKMNIQGL